MRERDGMDGVIETHIVGNRVTRVFHQSSCGFAQPFLHLSNWVRFASVKEAVEAHYNQCVHCEPLYK